MFRKIVITIISIFVYVLIIMPLKAQQAAILPSALYKFDFGTRNSMKMSGFTKVSSEDAYCEAKGYGWRGKRGGVERVYRKNGIMPAWALINPDPLCYDFVYAHQATFDLKLPNGKYQIVIISGDIGPRYGYPYGVRGYERAQQFTWENPAKKW